MKKKVSLILAAGLFAGAVIAYPTNDYTLTFNCADLAFTNIPDNFVGLSMGESYISGATAARPFDPAWNPGTSTTTWQQFTNILGQIGIHRWRTIENSCDGYTNPTPAEIDQFFGTLQDFGATNVIFSLNCFTNYASNAPVAVHIMSTQPDASMLESFALDNEPNFKEFQVPTNFTEPQYEVQWYLAYTQTEDALAAAGISWAPFSGPDDGSIIPADPGTGPGLSWALQFAIDEAPKRFYTMATQHDYDASCTAGIPNQPDALDMAKTNLNPQRVTNWNQVFNNLLGGPASWPIDWHGNPLPYRITEASAFNNGTIANSPASDGNTNGQTFSTALWELDFCHWWAQQGCSGVNPMNRPTDYNAPVQLDWNSGNWTAMPYAYGLLAFNQGGQGWPILADGLTYSPALSINMTAYGVLSDDGTTLYITLINKTFNSVGADAANVTIAAPQHFGKPTSASYLLLSSQSAGQDGDATALRTAYLGGATIPSSGQWNGQWTPMTVSSSGQVTNLLQPATAVIIKLSNN